MLSTGVMWEDDVCEREGGDSSLWDKIPAEGHATMIAVILTSVCSFPLVSSVVMMLLFPFCCAWGLAMWLTVVMFVFWKGHNRVEL